MDFIEFQGQFYELARHHGMSSDEANAYAQTRARAEWADYCKQQDAAGEPETAGEQAIRRHINAGEFDAAKRAMRIEYGDAAYTGAKIMTWVPWIAFGAVVLIALKACS